MNIAHYTNIDDFINLNISRFLCATFQLYSLYIYLFSCCACRLMQLLCFWHSIVFIDANAQTETENNVDDDGWEEKKEKQQNLQSFQLI